MFTVQSQSVVSGTTSYTSGEIISAPFLLQKHRFYRLLYHHVFCVRSFPAADTPILRRPVFRWCCKEIHFSRRKSRAAVPGGAGQQCGCGDSSRQKDLGLHLGFLCQEPAVSAGQHSLPRILCFCGIHEMQLFNLYSESKACESQWLGRLASGGDKQPYGEASCLPARHLDTTNQVNFSTLQPSK
ncbi:hypothetical protein JOQ06_009128 [Pogonophryne albipinna]|uniref:Uncharacterized protein n=1 Tax=Pogonophryne albipinna TaxID=1090488 RepID=A0AAD6FSY5_9TELE|nr:hypothetical protein JOQ06_009128 [Pogonophryne albipinna]